VRIANVSSGIFLLAMITMCYPDAILELMSKETGLDSSRKGVITVQLGPSDLIQTGTLAISNIRQDLDQRGIPKLTTAFDYGRARGMGAAVTIWSQPGGLAKALERVVSKLDLFIQIIDKTSKVSIL
jgi:hypothetical protein